MEIAEERRDGIVVLAPAGRLDTNTSGEFESRLLRELGAGARSLVIDLRGIDYVSSAGLRVLLVIAKKLREAGGQLTLCAMSPAVRQIFELSGFLTIFTVDTSRELAFSRLTGKG